MELCKELQAPWCKECGHELVYVYAEHFCALWIKVKKESHLVLPSV